MTRTDVSAVVLLLLCFSVTSSGWQENLTPRRFVPLDEVQVLSFPGNVSHRDHFRLLAREGSSLLIGARNVVFNVSLVDFTEVVGHRLEWHSPEFDVKLCLMKGLDEEACHNYIRVLTRDEDGALFVCGTNSYSPTCRRYQKTESGYTVVGKEMDGRGLSPYDPKHNNTATFADGELYTGTVADFAGSDPLIYRHPLRTTQFDLKQLNAPNFVGSVEYGDYVFFFFREVAVEYMNCGKRVFSRVARVCKKDRGSNKYKYGWTSFLKARLNCSIPGQYPFYFDEIQSISDIRTVTYGNRTEDILYAVFTTPPNSIPGSAVCAFSMKDVMRAFNGPFKHQDNMNSNWLPYRESQVPEPRPGQCVNDSRSLPDLHINFIRSHPLMDRPVSSLHGGPLLVRTSLRQRFTQIAVDWQVPAADRAAHDVLFIATDTGRVLKAVNAAAGPVLVEELQVFPPGARITSLLVAAGRLVAATEDEVRSVPLHRCTAAAAGRCSFCVRLQDPYCGWAPRLHRCVAVSSAGGQPLLQNITHGLHPGCPDDVETTVEPETSTVVPTTTTTEAPEPAPSVCNCSVDTSDVTAGTSDVIPPSPTAGVPPPPISDMENDIRRELYSIIEGGQKVLEIVEQAKAYPGGSAVIVSEYTASAASRTQDPRSENVYTAETLAVAVVTTCLVSMLIGFLTGWLFSRRYWRMRTAEPFYPTPHLDLQSKLKQIEIEEYNIKPDNRCDCSLPAKLDPTYLKNYGKQINLVVNQTKNLAGKNANSTAENRPVQKVRKMYL